MQNIIKEFPVLSQYTYVNTASSGLIYDALLEWRQGHDIDLLIGASLMKDKGYKYITEARDAVGRFFECKSNNVALVPNFSLGLNMLLEGLDKTHKVLLLENDYPSLNWSFENRKYGIYYTKINKDLEQNILEKIKSENISVLALSLVQWVNGIQVDLGFLKKLKRDFPNLIIIADGTQFCGTVAFNFDRSGIDVLVASAYKWLLAGYGNGFMLFSDSVKDKLDIRAIGYHAANQLNGERCDRNEIEFSKYFEAGHLDTLNFGSLKFSLDFLAEIGKEKIEAHLKMLSNMAKKEFTALGLLEDDVIKRKDHSTIFNIKGDDELFQRLAAQNIICSRRGNGIRFSFHFYNTEKDISKIVKVLKKRSRS